MILYQCDCCGVTATKTETVEVQFRINSVGDIPPMTSLHFDLCSDCYREKGGAQGVHKQVVSAVYDIIEAQ